MNSKLMLVKQEKLTGQQINHRAENGWKVNERQRCKIRKVNENLVTYKAKQSRK